MRAGKYSFPPSFDDNVASLWVWGITNDPSNSFNVKIKATFGESTIRINQGDNYIEAIMQINRANIILDYINSYPSDIFFEGKKQYFSIKNEAEFVHKTGSETAAAANFEGGFDTKNYGSNGGIKASFGAGIKGNKKTTFVRKIVSETSHSLVQLLNPNTLLVSHPPGHSSPIIGQVLEDETILKVIPDNKTMDYGIVARILVREPWINFTKITPYGKNRFITLINDFINWVSL